MSSSNEFLSRPLRILIIVGSVVLLAFFIWSSAEARKNTSNRVVDWIPQGTKELETFNYYYEHFPEGEYLMVSWKGCDIDDARLDIVAQKLTAPLEDGGLAHFGTAITTRSVIEDLIENIPQLTKEGAKNRLAGWLIGQDRKAACLVLAPPYDGWRYSAAEATEFLFTTIEQVTGLPHSEIYVAGPSIDAVAIDEISAKSQRTLLPFFLLFSLFLLFCSLRHYFAAFIVFWVAIINEELAGTLLFWFGAHVDSISMLNSSLVYVLTISGGVHLINYYRQTLAETVPGEEKNVPKQALYKALLPCSLSTFTTALGMGSLAISQMVPIKTFGIYASLALFLGTIWYFLYILSALQERPLVSNRRQMTAESNGGVVARVRPSAVGRLLSSFWERFGHVVLYCRYPIIVLTLLLLSVFAFGIKELRTSVSFHGLLPQDAKVLQDYRTLEDNVGGLIPIEVVVHFPDENGENKKMLDQLYFLASLVAELRKADDVDAMISVFNFLPHLPTQYGGGFRTVSERAAMESMLNRSQDRLRGLRFFDRVESGDGNDIENDNAKAGYYWRISLRISTQKKLDYAVLIADVEKRLETVRQQRKDMDVEKVRFDVTGAVPLVFRAQEMLLWDLIYSFMTAFGLIALTMMVALRGTVRGLLAMIPNLFPCVIVFGTLGFFGISVDMGSMMTASVALGISVDNSLHFLTWTNIALRRGNNRKDAVLYAIQRCSAALCQTMVICGMGMLVFACSDFVPVARFAILLCSILIISLAGAVIVLPAILFSPFGRFFEDGGKEKEKTL